MSMNDLRRESGAMGRNLLDSAYDTGAEQRFDELSKLPAGLDLSIMSLTTWPDVHTLLVGRHSN